MRIRPGLTQFSIVTRDGRSRQIPWAWLAPFFAVPVIAAVALGWFGDPLVSETIRRARWQPKVRGEALELLLHTSRAALENLVASKPPLAHSRIPTLHLEVPKNTLEAMQAALRTGDPLLGHLPGGDQPYFGATLTEDEGMLQRGEICLRGLSAWHHHPEKPSLRFKIKKDDVRGDRQYVELSRPEDVLALKNWIPDQLGKELGLLSDFSDHVRVFVNNKYFGVYLRSMRADEELSRKNRRMPGSFFKGEFRDDWSQWNEKKAFDALWGPSPTGWRSSIGATDENWPLFQHFLDVLREERGPESLAHLETLLDMEVYAKWAAVMVVTGSSHTDGFHNQLFFFEPNHGKLEAVPWDSNAYGMHSDAHTPADLVLHPVMELAISDPRWVHRRNQFVHRLLDWYAEPQHLDALIDNAVRRMLPDLEADTHLSSLELMPDLIPWSVSDIEPKKRELKAWAAQRHDFLSAYLDDARVFVEASSERPGWTRVDVAGAVAVKVARADGGDPRADTYAGTPDLLYPGLCTKLTDYSSNPGRKTTRKPYAPAAALTYFVRGAPDELRFTNAITNAEVAPRAGRFDGLPCEARTIAPAKLEAPPTGDVVLGPGEVRLDSDLHVGAQQRLLIQPGTRVRLNAGVGIYSRGKTLVLGTREAPVELLPAGSKPWASFGISGAAATGSRFEHLIAVGGSSGKDVGVEFEGMFNVYEASEVTLKSCRFWRNEAGGAAVHLASSYVQIDGCEWIDTRGTALDLDLCQGFVRDCRWFNGEGDGLRSMGSGIVVVRDCILEGCRDAGIRAGEDSFVDVHDTRITGCTIGVEITDRSCVELRCTRLERNGVAVREDHRSWQYGVGGFAALDSCTFENSGLADLSIGKRSRAALLDTRPVGYCDGADRIATVGSLGELFRAWDAFLESWRVPREPGKGLTL